MRLYNIYMKNFATTLVAAKHNSAAGKMSLIDKDGIVTGEFNEAELSGYWWRPYEPEPVEVDAAMPAVLQ